MAGVTNTVRPSLNKIFDSFRENPRDEPDEINAEGTSKLLEQLNIGLDDVAAFIFSEVVQSPTLGKVTREGFVDGFSALNIDTLLRMRTLLHQRRSALATDANLFKNVYNHTFQLALSPGAKTVPLDVATEFWRALFTTPGYDWRTDSSPWLDWWLEFQEAKRTKAVNKDLWKQTLTFARETMRDGSLGFWSDESSWPSVIDEFVEWVKTEKRPGGAGEDAMAMD